MENTNRKLIASLVANDTELQRILALQQENLLTNLSTSVQKEQDFVTLHHTSPGTSIYQWIRFRAPDQDHAYPINGNMKRHPEFADLISTICPSLFCRFALIKFRGYPVIRQPLQLFLNLTIARFVTGIEDYGQQNRLQSKGSCESLEGYAYVSDYASVLKKPAACWIKREAMF